MKLDGLHAVVSGGASGLGLATTHALQAAGARVSVFDIHREALAALGTSDTQLPVQCDVTDADSAEAAFAVARRRFGAERLVVNCAGVAPAGRILGRQGAMPLEDFRRVVNVNLVGSFNLLRLAAAHMKLLDPLDDCGRGLVVLTASIAAFEGQVGQAAYAASKAGVAGLVLPAARELAGLGIRVCAIAPGVFETPMVSGMPAQVQQSLAASVPFPQRLGRPAEYAQLVRHMAENSMVNGCVWRLDGAHRMGA